MIFASPDPNPKIIFLKKVGIFINTIVLPKKACTIQRTLSRGHLEYRNATVIHETQGLARGRGEIRASPYHPPKKSILTLPSRRAARISCGGSEEKLAHFQESSLL